MRSEDVAARTLTFILAGGEGIDAGDDIGYSPERDHQRFHALANGVMDVSPDHVLPFL